MFVLIVWFGHEARSSHSVNVKYAIKQAPDISVDVNGPDISNASFVQSPHPVYHGLKGVSLTALLLILVINSCWSTNLACYSDLGHKGPPPRFDLRV